MSSFHADPNETSSTESSHPRDRTPPADDDTIVWPEPSPLDSWWKHVIDDHEIALPEGESSIDVGT
ncbi:hypothetical protein EEB14_34180 [Rhodococcus sp. WS4]|nr:hypothetical protein EEB14_34180 [Rhodococcus sp. WS4]